MLLYASRIMTLRTLRTHRHRVQAGEIIRTRGSLADGQPFHNPKDFIALSVKMKTSEYFCYTFLGRLAVERFISTILPASPGLAPMAEAHHVPPSHLAESAHK